MFQTLEGNVVPCHWLPAPQVPLFSLADVLPGTCPRRVSGSLHIPCEDGDFPLGHLPRNSTVLFSSGYK